MINCYRPLVFSLSLPQSTISHECAIFLFNISFDNFQLEKVHLNIFRFNDKLAIAFSGRYYFAKQLAITFSYIYRIVIVCTVFHCVGANYFWKKKKTISLFIFVIFPAVTVPISSSLFCGCCCIKPVAMYSVHCTFFIIDAHQPFCRYLVRKKKKWEIKKMKWTRQASIDTQNAAYMVFIFAWISPNGHTFSSNDFVAFWIMKSFSNR